MMLEKVIQQMEDELAGAKEYAECAVNHKEKIEKLQNCTNKCRLRSCSIILNCTK